MRWLWGGGDARTRRLDPPAACPRIAEHERLTLHYPARWPVRQSPGEFLVRCSLEVIDLAELFGFTFPRPVAVYAFPTCEQIGEYFHIGRPAAGCASADQTAVAFALNGGNLLQIVRHELAHLYAAAWGPYPPAFKGEGLAVWCEYQRDRSEIDRLVRYALHDLGIEAGVSLPPLASLLDDEVFMQPRNVNWNYALAGSFTRWVVRQRGWPVYRDFYRTATTGNYTAEFVPHFGMTFSAAENGWHRHLHPLARGAAKLADRPPRWGTAE